MSDGQGEHLAQAAAEKPKRKSNQLGVRITVEFTGHIDKSRLEKFTSGLRSLVQSDVENGGNGS
jgi:hypothetical protein